MKRIGELAPTLMADHQARRGVMPPWGNGKRGKEFRATMGQKPIVGIFSVGLEEPYRWCHGAERYLRNERPLARVALVYSQQMAWFHPAERGRQHTEDATGGWYHALIEARIPFEMVHDRLLDAEHLAAFKTLILPNT